MYSYLAMPLSILSNMNKTPQQIICITQLSLYIMINATDICCGRVIQFLPVNSTASLLQQNNICCGRLSDRPIVLHDHYARSVWLISNY